VKDELTFSDYAYCFNCAAFSRKEEKNTAGITFPANYCAQRGEITKATSACSYFRQIKETISLQDYEKQIKKEKKETKKEDEDEVVSCTSLYISEDNHTIIEQVYDGNKSEFAKYNHNTKELSYIPEFSADGITYKPITDEEVAKRAVLLPSKAEEYGTDEQLETNLKNFITKWLDIPPDFLQFSVWNIKRSWVFERFHTLNYLRAMGDTGQGKTRLLDTLGNLHYKSIMTSGAVTAAPVFRVIDKWRGTMIFDEGDFKQTDETEQIIKIINMGYERGKFVMRCDQNDATKLMFFDPFCPKIISTRKPFEDKALESRCITQVMLGTRRKDINFTLNDTFNAEALTLRNKLLFWRFRNYFEIDTSLIPTIDLTHLEPRVQQIVSSYIALFGKNQVQMDQFKTFIEEYQADLIAERADSWEGQVVTGIHALISRGQLDISASDIIEEGQMTNERGNFYKPRALSNVLKELGFGKNVVKRVGDKTKRCIPLVQEHLNNLFLRYGVTVVTRHGGSPGTVIEPQLTDFLANVTEGGGSPQNRNNRNMVTTVTENVPEEIVSDAATSASKMEENAEFCDKTLLALIISLDRESGGKGVDYAILAHLLAERGFSENEVTFALDSLLKMGEVFENRPGNYKPL
jgi:hypothetical protein